MTIKSISSKGYDAVLMIETELGYRYRHILAGSDIYEYVEEALKDFNAISIRVYYLAQMWTTERDNEVD